MIDRIFGALLTFCLLAGGSLAVGSAMLDHDRQVDAIRPAAQAPQIVVLPTVEITVKRARIAQTDPVEPTASQLQ